MRTPRSGYSTRSLDQDAAIAGWPVDRRQFACLALQVFMQPRVLDGTDACSNSSSHMSCSSTAREVAEDHAQRAGRRQQRHATVAGIFGPVVASTAEALTHVW
jgi:hypothetical protein